MLDFAIFAVCFVVFLLMLVFYLYPGSSKQTTIPGVDPSDPREGNVGDIILAGGLHSFLVELHKTHGPIASFWIGTKLVVSLGSADLLKEQAHVFDKPADLLELYRTLVGTKSILFANGIEARKRRQQIDKAVTGDLSALFPQLHQLCKEVIDQWSELPPDQHVPVYKYMYALCMKTCTRLLFGNHFFNDEHVFLFSRAFETCMIELEEMSKGTLSDADSPRAKTFEKAAEKMRAMLRAAILERKEKKAKDTNTLLIDVLSGPDFTADNAVDDCVAFTVKHYSLISAMTWALYFLATHPELQSSIAREADEVMSADAPLTTEDFLKVKTVNLAIRETLRTAVVEPWTARVQDVDVKIGGHIIPKKTPVIHALGLAMHCEEHWPVPHRFDVAHFEKESEGRPPEAFSPFGFAGKRQCPGQDLATLQMAVFLVMVCRKLKLELVENQVVKPTYAVVTKPEDEVWLLLSRRR